MGNWMSCFVLRVLLLGNCSSVLRRWDNKAYFARQASASVGYFMRQTSVEEGDSTSLAAHKTKDAKFEGPSNAGAPCFARPARTESTFSNSVVQPMTKAQGCDYSTLEPPTFARPSRQTGQGDQLNNEKQICYSEIGGIEWPLEWMLQNQKANMLSWWKFQVSISVTHEWRLMIKRMDFYKS